MKKKNTFLLLLIIAITPICYAQTYESTLLELNFTDGSNPQSFVSDSGNNGFYFTAENSVSGRELWYSNGTTSGTRLIKDIFSGTESSNPVLFTLVNENLFFIANDGVHGTELWKTDGTTSGTILVKDFRPNNSSANSNIIRNFISYNGNAYFSYDDGVNGEELWISDGTDQGTKLFIDIRIGSLSSNPNNYFVFKGELYFTADDGMNGKEVWKTDGTSSGTSILKDINPSGSGVANDCKFIVLNDLLMFYATTNLKGAELWKSNGTSEGTVLVKDILLGSRSSNHQLEGIYFNNSIVFKADDGTNGYELWKTDGTESGTFMLKNINTNSFGNGFSYSTPVFAKDDTYVYFLADDGVNGDELWKTDAIQNGVTGLVKNISQNNKSIEVKKIHYDSFHKRLMFYAYDQSNSNYSLWISNGTEAGTIEIEDVKGVPSSGYGYEEYFVTLNNKTIFNGSSSVNGVELWSTTNSLHEVMLLRDLSYSNSGNPSKFINVNGELFFNARKFENGTQLLKSNGTLEGTTNIVDINNKNVSIGVSSEMKSINETLFYSAHDGIHGFELWKSDGTKNGTKMVKDIYSGNTSSMKNHNEIQRFYNVNDRLYFSANNGGQNWEPWVSDGTEDGTYMISDINTITGSDPSEFVSFNDAIYFIATGANGNGGISHGLWKTNNTHTVTERIISLNRMDKLRVVNNKLLIVAETSNSSYAPHDLWVSDGTTVGTSHIKTFGIGSRPDIKFANSTIGKDIYIIANSPENGQKAIYKTDGTITGTKLVFSGKDDHPEYNIGINSINECDEYIYFSVSFEVGGGNELWRTNGDITEKVDETPNTVFNNFKCIKSNLFYIHGYEELRYVNKNLNNSSSLAFTIKDNLSFDSYAPIHYFEESNGKIFFNSIAKNSGTELFVFEPNFSTLNNEEFSWVDDTNANMFSFYPNPTDSGKSISFKSEKLTIRKVQIYDLKGRLLGSKLLKATDERRLSLINYKPGVYVVNVVFENGGKASKKLIIN
jgi:ELWxxDGT repeat protein